MITPRRALVRPRVVLEQSGLSLPLDSVLLDLIANSRPVTVCLMSPVCGGKTTALEHLASLFGDREILFIDEPQPSDLAKLPRTHWIIFTSTPGAARIQATHTFPIAPWGQDECVEYLIAVHKEHCGSVLSRLRNDPSLALLQGNPQLYRIVLDEMAADELLSSARDALQKHLQERFSRGEDRIAAELIGFQSLQSNSEPSIFSSIFDMKAPDAMGKLIRHRPMLLILAVSFILRNLNEKERWVVLENPIPRDLVNELAVEARRQPALLDIFREALNERLENRAMAASILHASGTPWSPKTGIRLKLIGAYLSYVNWQGIVLPYLNISSADLRSAELQDARLGEVHAVLANLRNANLSGAAMDNFFATNADLVQANFSGSAIQDGLFDGADLEGADFMGAKLRGASFASANLTRTSFQNAFLAKACFTGAILDETDFTNADLSEAKLSQLKLKGAWFTDARFQRAELVGSDLEELELPNADFREANLQNALLTGSTMPDACFDDACLVGAGLAEIDWERASLCGADLSGVSFHLGSTRCGLVGSPIASEGSRTGFYTDEYTEQGFKAPEEIRKANLCHADLRGALINDVDFYLVDLRHAKFDPEQEIHLRRCGAILEDHE